MAHGGPSRHRQPRARVAINQRQQAVRVQRVGNHLQLAVAHRPLRARPVAVDFDAVAIRIAQIDRLANAVVRPALQRPARLNHMPQPARQFNAIRHQHGEMVKPCGVLRLRRRTAHLDQLKQRRAIRTTHLDATVASGHLM